MKILIVGLGSIGARHLNNFSIINPANEFYVLRRPTSKKYIEKHPSQTSALPTYHLLTDFNAAISTNPDIVVIANPSYLHSKSIKNFYQKTNAVILVEKPCAISLDEIESLAKEADGGRVFVAQQMRFHPIAKYIKDFLDNKYLGECVGFQCKHSENVKVWHPWESYMDSYVSKKSMGGGSFLTQNHELDLCCFLFGIPSLCTTVKSETSELGIDCDSIFSSLFVYRNEVSAMHGYITANLLCLPPQKKMQIDFLNGILEVDFINNKVSIMENHGTNDIPKYICEDYSRNIPYLEMARQITSYAISKDHSLMDRRMVTLKEGLSILKFMYKSLDTKCA